MITPFSEETIFDFEAVNDQLDDDDFIELHMWQMLWLTITDTPMRNFWGMINNEMERSLK